MPRRVYKDPGQRLTLASPPIGLAGKLRRDALVEYESLIRKTLVFCRDAGNGKKGTKSSPQQDKAAADTAGRKAAVGVPGSGSEMAEGNQSPPKAEVDDSPLQHAMDRNKECEYTHLSLTCRRKFSPADRHFEDGLACPAEILIYH